MGFCKQAEQSLSFFSRVLDFSPFMAFLPFFFFFLALELISGYLFIYLCIILIQFLKVTLHSQLLQNIGYIPRVTQYILEPVLHPVVFTSHFPTRRTPPTPAVVTTSLFSVSVSQLLLHYIHQFVVCFRFRI